MDSKNTKATRRLNTWKKFFNSDPAKNTVEASKASKNFSTHSRGLTSEERVVDFYRRRDFVLLRQRQRHKFAEIDLIFQKNKKLILVEVKTLADSEFVQWKVSQRQRQRLSNAFHYYLHKYPELEVECHMVTVDHSGHIQVYDDFLGS